MYTDKPIHYSGTLTKETNIAGVVEGIFIPPSQRWTNDLNQLYIVYHWRRMIGVRVTNDVPNSNMIGSYSSSSLFGCCQFPEQHLFHRTF